MFDEIQTEMVTEVDLSPTAIIGGNGTPRAELAFRTAISRVLGRFPTEGDPWTVQIISSEGDPDYIFEYLDHICGLKDPGELMKKFKERNATINAACAYMDDPKFILGWLRRGVVSRTNGRMDLVIDGCIDDKRWSAEDIRELEKLTQEIKGEVTFVVPSNALTTVSEGTALSPAAGLIGICKTVHLVTSTDGPIKGTTIKSPLSWHVGKNFYLREDGFMINC